MAFEGNDQVLMRTAVFCLAFSLMATMLISIEFSDNADGDYDYDAIQGYRDELHDFTGQSMLDSTPWVLKHVYTPWVSGMGLDGHVDNDRWLYGEEITDYAYLNKSADIRLDVNQKSSVPITVDDRTEEYQPGEKLWYYDSDKVGWFSGLTTTIAKWAGYSIYDTSSVTVTQWDYTGYRYVFDPTLPFKDSSDQQTSVRDGALSIVWYSYNGQEGLSGGLDVYGGEVLLASYSAADIVAGYSSSSSYASHYGFDFQGVLLDLYIRFDPEDIQAGTPLMSAWTQGHWSMAISSVSAGNFFDIDDSISFSSTAGGVVKTFQQIFTFSVPGVDNALAQMLIWLVVMVPMTICMALVALRMIQAAKPLG